MTDNNSIVFLEEEKQLLKRAAFVFFVSIVSICFFSYLGSRAGIPFKAEAIAFSPFEDGFLSGCAVLCVSEIIAVAVFSICKSIWAVSGAAFTILGLRCAALGAAGVFSMANSIPRECLAVLISYGGATFFLCLYAPMFYILRQKSTFFVRLLIYVLATGTVSIIRITPYLLISL